MKKTFIFILLIFSVLQINPLTETEFILSVIDKNETTFQDAVIAFTYLCKLKPQVDYNANIENLKKTITYFPKKHSAEKLLTYGDFALLVIQKLEIQSGIFYLSTKSGRYALRELALLNFFPANTSEFKIMSGTELVKYLQKVTEYEEKYKK